MKTEMYSPKHTPGPWVTGENDWRVIIGQSTRFYTPEFDPEARFLVGVATVDRSDSEAEDLANARLIAAAPELLAVKKIQCQSYRVLLVNVLNP